MAIIKCPECGREVSNKAPVCPHCGYVINVDNYDVKNRKTRQVARIPALKGEKDSETLTNPQKKKRETHWWVWIVIIFFTIVIAYVGISFYLNYLKNEKVEILYKEALESNDLAVMQEFLDLHPDISGNMRRRLEGKMRIAQRTTDEWESACNTSSIIALKAFIRNHPNDIHVPEAKVKIDSLDWQTALRLNTTQAYRTYMMQHREGEYYGEAQSRCDMLNIEFEDKMTVKNAIEEYMENENSAIPLDTYRSLGDYKITKHLGHEMTAAYQVTFTVEKRSSGAEDAMLYQVRARISADGMVENIDKSALNIIDED